MRRAQHVRDAIGDLPAALDGADGVSGRRRAGAMPSRSARRHLLHPSVGQTAPATVRCARMALRRRRLLVLDGLPPDAAKGLGWGESGPTPEEAWAELRAARWSAARTAFERSRVRWAGRPSTATSTCSSSPARGRGPDVKTPPAAAPGAFSVRGDPFFRGRQAGESWLCGPATLFLAPVRGSGGGARADDQASGRLRCGPDYRSQVQKSQVARSSDFGYAYLTVRGGRHPPPGGARSARAAGSLRWA